ncbi:MAG: hypothetical protein H6711_17310 [Myxococcales bacterium]|nr:hypothetical protein [Myxococcales bacterium]
MNHLRLTSLMLVGALALVGCGKDPENETSASTTNASNSSDGSTGGSTSTTTTGAGSASDGQTGSTGAGTATDATGTTGCGIFGCTTGGTDVAMCDVWAQDCPEGEKCMPWANDGGSSWNALKCTPVDPNPGQAGDACTVEGNAVSGIDSCDKGLLCWYVNDMNMGSCLPMCTGTEDAPMCPADSVCDVTNEGTLILCLPTCDPLLVDCPDNQICFFSDLAGKFICDFDASGEDGKYGDPCEYINVCDPGLFCADASVVPGCQAAGCCSEYCDINLPNTCAGAPEQECVPWYEEGMAPPGLEHVGGCAIPA